MRLLVLLLLTGCAAQPYRSSLIEYDRDEIFPAECPLEAVETGTGIELRCADDG